MGTLKKVRESVYDYKSDTMSKGEILGTLLEDCFNGELSGVDKAELCRHITQHSHRYLQSEMFRFVLRYIKTYAEMPDRCFDGRNDWVKKVAKEICDTATSAEGFKIFEYENPIGLIKD